MKIRITKTTPYQCEYAITRDDQSVEWINLDAKTFLLHDIVHFVVEKELGYANGFWGMLAQGYSFPELFGKENSLTAELRFMEKIVGPVQSVFLGHIPPADFPIYIEHLNFDLEDHFLEDCLAELKQLTARWEQLATGQSLSLEWNT